MENGFKRDLQNELAKLVEDMKGKTDHDTYPGKVRAF